MTLGTCHSSVDERAVRPGKAQVLIRGAEGPGGPATLARLQKVHKHKQHFCLPDVSKTDLLIFILQMQK